MGLPPAGLVEEARRRGIALIGTATTADEVRRLIAAGIDMICIQGAEAGGHSGMFSADGPPPSQSWASLIEAMAPEAEAAGVTLIVAGGIMTGRGVAAALALGAAGAQLGTAFMATAEAGTRPGHRQLLQTSARAGGAMTVLTRSYTGRYARKLLSAGEAIPPEPTALAAFPAQHGLTKPIRAAADAAGCPKRRHTGRVPAPGWYARMVLPWPSWWPPWAARCAPPWPACPARARAGRAGRAGSAGSSGMTHGRRLTQLSHVGQHGCGIAPRMVPCET
ncbi:nitronate monooxygenase [Tistrella bauzanensis]